MFQEYHFDDVKDLTSFLSLLVVLVGVPKCRVSKVNKKWILNV